MKKSTIADKILKKMNTPKSRDIDIETEDFNAGDSTKNDNFGSGNDDSDSDDDAKMAEEQAKRSHYVPTDKSKIKKTTINLGEKYVGSKVDRSELFDHQSEEEQDSEQDSEINEDEEEGSDILADITDSEAEDMEEIDDNSDQEQFVSEDEENIQSQSEDEDEQFKRTQITKLIQEEKEQVISRASNTAKVDALKGFTILKQGSQFDKILDSRIKIQKAIINGNSLPINPDALAEFQTEKTPELLKEVNTKLFDLIKKLTKVRSITLKSITKQEDIPNPKKRKLKYMIETNLELNNLETPIRKTILTKWSNRVQSASGMGALNQNKFKVLNQSIWTQVNNELNDIDRLVKKTKINRRGITPLGYKDEQKKEIDDDDDLEENDGGASLSNIDKTLQSNEFIFDDDDFYRLLLNDMINKKLDQKQSNSQAILMLSKNKLQKNYDRMATKGRKLKYTVQDSLVQFEMPKRERFNWDDDQIDELFAGLMGMKVQMDESDEEDAVEDAEHEDLHTFKESGVKLFG